MNKYHFLIVGGGLFGCTAARLLVDKGYSICIWERDYCLGGHCADEVMNGILCCTKGPHIVHTSNDKVWAFLNRFTEFNQYKLKVLSRVGDSFYSFPINFLTLHQLLGIRTPEEARQFIKSDLVPNSNPQNLEEQALALVGKTLYEVFIKNYTTKQWKTDPKNLPKEILNRIPFRLNANDAYFAKHQNKYEGMPIGGYTKMMEKMVEDPHITVMKGKTFTQEDRISWKEIAHNLIYTGPIDSFFSHKYGKLPYRSLRFEYEWHDIPLYQGAGVVNYPDKDIPWTRITEHKHFADNSPLLEKVGTIISKEYPSDYEETGEAYYPINTSENNKLYQKYYKDAVGLENVYFGGRLAEYKYYDMCPTVESAMKLCEKL